MEVCFTNRATLYSFQQGLDSFLVVLIIIWDLIFNSAISKSLFYIASSCLTYLDSLTTWLFIHNRSQMEEKNEAVNSTNLNGLK